MKLIILASLLFLFPSYASAEAIQEIYSEADKTFTYQSKPIHPFLLQEFSNWLSDNRPPMIHALDVRAAFDTNKYNATVEKRGDWWFSEEQEMDGDITLYESFGYHWLGKLANGTHVLETGASGGGTGFFMDLMFVRFSKGQINWNGKQEEQLLMTIMGIYSLGDRYEADIKVYPDKVVVPPSNHQLGGGSIEQQVELKF